MGRNCIQRAADCDCGVPQSLAFPNITKNSVSRDISDKPKTSHNHKLLLCVRFLYLLLFVYSISKLRDTFSEVRDAFSDFVDSFSEVHDSFSDFVDSFSELRDTFSDLAGIISDSAGIISEMAGIFSESAGIF